MVYMRINNEILIVFWPVIIIIMPVKDTISVFLHKYTRYVEEYYIYLNLSLLGQEHTLFTFSELWSSSTHNSSCCVKVDGKSRWQQGWILFFR